MSNLRVNITMSVDGYVAGPNQTLKEPLGVGGEALHDWFIPTRTFQQVHGKDGGETGTDDDVASETFDNVGATIMGRHMFGGGDAEWSDDWKGWWGKNPPYHTAVFILTHYAREPVEMEGGTTYYFVTEGIHVALERAREAAGGKDIHLAGGAEVIQQYLKAGLIDEISLHVVPLMLGGGARLFDETDGRQTEFECIRVVSTPAATHLKYRRRT